MSPISLFVLVCGYILQFQVPVNFVLVATYFLVCLSFLAQVSSKRAISTK